VNSSYLLAQSAAPLRMPLRSPPNLPRLKLSDPATRAMTDFISSPPLTVGEEYLLQDAVDHMFRMGARALLVVHDRKVVGMMTAGDAARSAPHHSRVVEAMTLTENVPAIGWDTLADSKVSDLLEIFDGTGVNYLVVLESHSASLSSVRGLIQRERLRRQLSSPWTLQES
jgi:predicted transcriptional regulator